MGEPLWSFEQLARFTRYEDAEVRFWAADRLVHLYPDKAADAIADLLFDDHDSTPLIVAGHLGSHGSEKHVPDLVRGFRKGSGALPGHCLAALARRRFADAPKLAGEALHRRDLGEDALAQIVAGLADMAVAGGAAGARGSEEAADAAREILLRRQELYADPVALQGCLKIFGDDGLGDLAAKWITALHFRGIEPAESGIQIIQEDLQMEDISWCLRTDRAGRVDLERSLRAIENGYDCEVRTLIPQSEREMLSAAFAGGEFKEMAARLTSLVESRARAAAAASTDLSDPLPKRIAGLASGFGREGVLTEADRLGHPLHTWVIGLLMSALIKTAGYRNLARESAAASRDLDALLKLAEIESSVLPRIVPSLLAAAAEAGGGAGRDRLEQWCVRTLEARGPFYPKVTAINAIGEMALSAQIPLLVSCLSDDNGFIFGAAEKALVKFGDEAVDTVRAELERRQLHPDSMHSLLVITSDLMTPASLSLVLDHFDDFMEAAGADEGAEHASLFGAKELIPHLRRWLKRSEGSASRVALQARVGHALLLVGAINNVPIPEEERILQAIDDYWKETSEEPGEGPGASGPYVM
jgi:hypothetical protein